MDTDTQNGEEILTREEACAFLKISKGTLRKLCIPTVHLGRRRIVYQKSAILAFLKENMKGGKK